MCRDVVGNHRMTSITDLSAVKNSGSRMIGGRYKSYTVSLDSVVSWKKAKKHRCRCTKVQSTQGKMVVSAKDDSKGLKAAAGGYHPNEQERPSNEHAQCPHEHRQYESKELVVALYMCHCWWQG